MDEWEAEMKRKNRRKREKTNRLQNNCSEEHLTTERWAGGHERIISRDELFGPPRRSPTPAAADIAMDKHTSNLQEPIDESRRIGPFWSEVWEVQRYEANGMASVLLEA